MLLACAMFVSRSLAIFLSVACLLFSPRAPSVGLSTDESLEKVESSMIKFGKRNNRNRESSECIGERKCCMNPVYKTLPLGKLIPLETGKHYLVRHVRLLRCPSTLGCCESFREQCVPLETENVSVSIPVEVAVGHHQYAYVNETFSFEQHVQCGCRNRSHQALANYISRELLSQYDADEALDMVARICRAVKRRIKKLRKFDSRFRVHRKLKRARRARLC